MNYQIVEVQSAQDWKDFHALPFYIYRKDPHWIAPLQQDIENIFSPAKNKTYQKGEAQIWLLRNESGKAIGRIAAFIDHERNEQLDYPVGGLGFFECINDAAAARLLFQTAEDHLRQKGIKAIDGPINFGERDKFWGLLVRGWHPPIYQENYNPAYYQEFFTDFGFKPHEQILTFFGAITDFPGERTKKIADRLRERYGMHCEYLDKNDLPGAAENFAKVYNQAFSHWPYFKEIAPAQILDVLKEMKPIADPKLVVFCFAEGEPVAFCGMIPDLNCHLRHAKGKLNLWTLPRFFWSLRFGKKQQAKGIAFGAIPEYQRKGATSLLISYMYYLDNQHNARKHKNVVLATIRGHNPLMVKTMETMNVRIQREHTAYRKMLDDSLAQNAFDSLDTSEVDMGKLPAEGKYPTV